MAGHSAIASGDRARLLWEPRLAYAAGVRVPAIRLLLAALCLAAASPARGDEALLRGPYPFARENELSARAGYAVGLGDAPSGTRLQLDYGFGTQRGLWLNIQMGLVADRCLDGVCSPEAGTMVDVVAGAKWKFQTTVPLVPYARLAVGPVFMFPEATPDTPGILVRGALGANYFLVEWLGLGVELAGSWGQALYDLGAMRTGTLGSVDFMLGAELEF
jgi:hypothetical protein